jgi:hypothetical protein
MYDAATKKFTVDTDDVTLYDTTKTYTLTATLKSYGNFGPSASRAFTVTYDNPCKDPFSFLQDSNLPSITDAFSGTK